MRIRNLEVCDSLPLTYYVVHFSLYGREHARSFISGYMDAVLEGNKVSVFYYVPLLMTTSCSCTL